MGKIFFKNRKGERLVGMLDHVTYDRIVVFLHGFESSKEIQGRREDIIRKFVEAGYSFFSFDFAGCGESPGVFEKTSVKSRSQDYSSALSFLRKEGYKSFFVIGSSMGAAVAINHPDKKVKALALLVPLTQLHGVYDKIMHPDSMIEFIGKLAFKKIHTQEFFKELKSLSLDKKIRSITSPTIMIQAGQDPIIDSGDSKKTYRMLKCKKKYVEVVGTHWLLIPSSFSKALDEILKWFSKWV